MLKQNEIKKAYGAFAHVYDRLMSEKKYTGWSQLIDDIVEKYSITQGICLDIACGTGRVSRLLLNKGFEVIGIDSSETMIDVARENYPEATFIKADIRDFKIEKNREKIAFAVSFYDSLNYLLSDDDMLKMFKTVASNLPERAIFLFDMNTREHVSASQNISPRIFEDEDSFTTFRFSGEGRIWVLDIDVFLKGSNGLHTSFKEQHVEKGYDEDDIKPLLGQAGLQFLEVRKEYKTYEDGKEHLSRLYFIVKR